MRPDRELGLDCVARIDDWHSLMVAHSAQEVPFPPVTSGSLR
jgi:hypothetical protein